MFFAALLTTSMFVAATADDKKDQKKPLSEKDKIEALIKHVEGIKNAKFVRNDVEYDAKTAVAFLRGKWDNAKDVETANDFIDKCATKSTTTGKDYLIRFKDGKEKKCADYLKDELKKIEK